jgi:hypothetical protein
LQTAEIFNTFVRRQNGFKRAFNSHTDIKTADFQYFMAFWDIYTNGNFTAGIKLLITWK